MKIFATSLLFASTLFASQAAAHDLRPDAKIGNLYCYQGWDGDTDISAHAILTDRPLRAMPVYSEGDPGYELRRGTRFIEIEIQHFVARPGWDVSYNDASFYKKHRSVGVRCLRRSAPSVVAAYPTTRIHRRKQAADPH